MGTEQKKIAAQNKKAFHDYFVLDRYEAGIELCGTAVKSIRQGKLNLKDSWCSIVDGELFVNGMHTVSYTHLQVFVVKSMTLAPLDALGASSCLPSSTVWLTVRSFLR